MNDQVSAVVRDASQVVEYVCCVAEYEGAHQGAVGRVDLVEVPFEVLVGYEPEEAAEEGHALDVLAGRVRGTAGAERGDHRAGVRVNLQDLVLRITVYDDPEGPAYRSRGR